MNASIPRGIAIAGAVLATLILAVGTVAQIALPGHDVVIPAAKAAWACATLGLLTAVIAAIMKVVEQDGEADAKEATAMIESLFFAVMFSPWTGVKTEIPQPSMKACVEYVSSRWNTFSKAGGTCDERVGDITVCFVNVIGAPFWDDRTVMEPRCIPRETIAKLRRLPS